MSALSEAAQANIQTGVLLLVKEALCTALFDRRLDRGHRIVLGPSPGTSMAALPGHGLAGKRSLRLTGLSPKTVSNVISELRDMGYLVKEREAVEEVGGRCLTVYTFGISRSGPRRTGESSGFPTHREL